MKKIIGLAMSLVLVMATFVGCGSKSPKDVTGEFYDSLKNMNIEKLQSTLSENENKLENKNTEDISEENKKLAKNVFSKIDYKIETVNESDNEANVIVKVTAVNGAEIIKEYMATSFSKALSNMGKEESKEQQDKEMNEILTKILSKKELPLSNQSVTVYLKKGDKGWKITNADDVLLTTFNLGALKGFLEK